MYWRSFNRDYLPTSRITRNDDPLLSKKYFQGSKVIECRLLFGTEIVLSFLTYYYVVLYTVVVNVL